MCYDCSLHLNFLYSHFHKQINKINETFTSLSKLVWQEKRKVVQILIDIHYYETLEYKEYTCYFVSNVEALKKLISCIIRSKLWSRWQEFIYFEYNFLRYASFVSIFILQIIKKIHLLWSKRELKSKNDYDTIAMAIQII